MPTATFEEACRSKLGIQNLTSKKMSFVFVEYQRCSLVSTLVTFMSNCFSQGLNWNQHQGCELSKAQYMRSIEIKRCKIFSKDRMERLSFLGGLVFEMQALLKTANQPICKSNHQMWRSLSSMSIIGFIHLTIAIQPSIISGRPHI